MVGDGRQVYPNRPTPQCETAALEDPTRFGGTDASALDPLQRGVSESRIIGKPFHPDELVHKVRPEKRVTFRLKQAVDASLLSGLGKVVTHEPAEVVLQVPSAAVNETVGRALASLPVQDLTVENPPLEEVMSELFARSRAAQGQG